MFINLTARKPNGDFIITSSEVEMERDRALNEFNIRLYMKMKADALTAQGWTVTLDEDIEDPRQYAEDSADLDAIYYGA